MDAGVSCVNIQSHDGRGGHDGSQVCGSSREGRDANRLDKARRHSHSFISISLPQQNRSMGDSITEGTIKSWEKNVGDVVALDDVVVVIETDKVSVDIRAKDKGILVEQFAAVDDNVDVGANLLKIDTSATASASAPSAAQKLVPSDAAPDAAPASVPAPASAPASDPAPTTASEVQRKPLIKFLGKRSLIGKDIPAAASAAQMARTGAAATGPAPGRYEDLKSTPGSKTFDEMPAMFGRPSLSEKEIEAIESGGATL